MGLQIAPVTEATRTIRGNTDSPQPIDAETASRSTGNDPMNTADIPSAMQTPLPSAASIRVDFFIVVSCCAPLGRSGAFLFAYRVSLSAPSQCSASLPSSMRHRSNQYDL
jgi:hypothetical protein